MQRFKRFTLTTQPLPCETRLLVMADRDGVMSSILGVATGAHPYATVPLLKELSLNRQQTLSVVLCADAEAGSFATPMFDDDLVPGMKTVHADVEIAFRVHPQERQGRRPIHGLGNEGDLRPLCGEGLTP